MQSAKFWNACKKNALRKKDYINNVVILEYQKLWVKLIPEISSK